MNFKFESEIEENKLEFAVKSSMKTNIRESFQRLEVNVKENVNEM